MKEKCPTCGQTFSPNDAAGLCPYCLVEMVENEKERTALSNDEKEMPLKLGEEFQGLKIIKIIGRGGMGIVYKAQQQALDRTVALKLMPHSLEEDPEFQQRFQREAKALAGLSHSNIVTIYDFGTDGYRSYFIMEFVDGTDLRSVMQSGDLTVAESLQIISQICDALAYAHSQDVVHRDIKPENILLTKQGQVKIADYGLAKIVGEKGKGTTRLTNSNLIMGSPNYMAPEQVESPDKVDHRADIYSMGVVFYEMLTGELPMGSFAPPSQKSQVDQRLDKVVLRTLAKEPENRYQQATEVKEAVSRIERSVGWLGLSGGIGRKVAIAALFLVAVGIALFQIDIFGIKPTDEDVVEETDEPGFVDEERSVTLMTIFFTEDDLPGRYVFAQPDPEEFPRNPLYAMEKGEIQLISANLDSFGVRNLSPALFDLAYQAFTFRNEFGYFGAIAKDESTARYIAEQIKESKVAINKWVYREGKLVVFAYQNLDTFQTLISFQHMVNELHKKLKLTPPYTLPGVDRVTLRESDLPPGCWFEAEPIVENPQFANDTKSINRILSKLLLDEYPSSNIQEAYYAKIKPWGIGVLSASISDRVARNAFIDSVESSLKETYDNVNFTLGSLVTFCWIDQSTKLSRVDYNAIRHLLSERYNKERGEQSIKEKIGRAAAMSTTEFAEYDNLGSAINLDDLKQHSFTALVLSLPVGDPDIHWVPGQTREDLYKALYNWSSKYVSIAQEKYLTVLSDHSAKAVVQGVLTVEFKYTFSNDEVIGFELPSSGHRVFLHDGRWTHAP